MQNLKSTSVSTSTISPERGEWSITISKNEPKKTSQLSRIFEDDLKGTYWAGKALSIAFSKMIKSATSIDLLQALITQLEETLEQVERLEKVFDCIGSNPAVKRCEAIEVMITEAEFIMDTCKSGDMCDAGIILVCQKLGHYEITTYGSLCVMAKILGEMEVSTLLQLTLDDKQDFDDNLSQIAQSISVNKEEEEYLLKHLIFHLAQGA